MSDYHSGAASLPAQRAKEQKQVIISLKDVAQSTSAPRLYLSGATA
jgi:hypothetical protein